MGVSREVYCARIGGVMVTNEVKCTVCMERKDIKEILEIGIKIPEIKLRMHSSATTLPIYIKHCTK
jgi:hypothetical protein